MPRKKIKSSENEVDTMPFEGEEMARIGFADGGLEVFVYTDDEEIIPHVHIRDDATRGKRFSTCILIDKAEYFLHGPNKNKLDAKQLRDFVAFMRAKPKLAPYQTNWHFAASMWNVNNFTSSVDETQQTLDYSLLNAQ